MPGVGEYQGPVMLRTLKTATYFIIGIFAACSFSTMFIGGDCTYKKGCLASDNDVRQLRKHTVCGVVLRQNVRYLGSEIDIGMNQLALAFLALPPTWGINKSTPNGASLSSR
jgi:hypothetical protein